MPCFVFGYFVTYCWKSDVIVDFIKLVIVENYVAVQMHAQHCVCVSVHEHREKEEKDG